MITLFNVVWFVFVGWWSALLTLISAGFMALTIIGWPIAKSLFNFAKLNAFPFGKKVVRETTLKAEGEVSNIRQVFGMVANILWLLTFGWVYAVLYVIFGIVCFFTIIGIPAGIVYVRSAKFILWPIGAKVVSDEKYMASVVANEIDRRANLSKGNNVTVNVTNTNTGVA
tara:strand:- start:44 stop:553 length:510 start_codon:yes stop_codon:yes gene_type:complete